ncbi:hypothetical protein N008_19095 [Hymenobacter sp. APR13]|nr:hypothetical protein N008_19095 [Hymenobacter sp. APR13]
MKQRVIDAFKKEFAPIESKFEIMDLLDNNSPMDYKTIDLLKLPSAENNIVWHPGVYVFIGDDKVYRVGVSMRNSRYRVMEHIKVQTQQNGYCIGDIDCYSDKSILLFNVKKRDDRHWLLALEVYLETEFKPLIKAGRIG